MTILSVFIQCRSKPRGFPTLRRVTFWEAMMIARYLIALALIVAVTIVCLLEKSWIESEMHEPFFSPIRATEPCWRLPAQPPPSLPGPPT